MRDDLLTTAPQQLLRQLMELTKQRSEREEVVESRYRQEKQQLEGQREKRISGIERDYEAATRLAREERDAIIRQVTQRFDRDEKAVQEAYQSDREDLLEKAEENETKAKSKLEEAIWLSETVYEANRDQPQEAYEETCRVLDALRAEVDSLDAAGHEFLRRSRVASVARDGDLPSTEGESSKADTERPQPQSARQRLEASMESARAAVAELRASRLLRLMQGIKPFALAALITAAGAATGAAVAGWQSSPEIIWYGGGALAGAVLLLLLMYLAARKRAAAMWRGLAGLLRDAAELCDAARVEAEHARDERARELKETRDREIAEAREKFDRVIAHIHERRDRRLTRIDEKYPALLEKLRRERAELIEQTENDFREQTRDAEQARDAQMREVREQLDTKLDELERWYQQERAELESQWKNGMAEAHALREAIAEEDARCFPDWDDPLWRDWNPPHEFIPAVRFGRLRVDLNALPGGMPDDERLAVPGPVQFDLPATIRFPDRCSLYVESDGSHGDRPVRIVQNVMLRLLTCLPPGKVHFTIVDPVGLGQNFAGFMHLADFNEALVGNKIWTEPRHIEQRLADLTEHMENVIQKYLRNEFETINQYNEQAGEIAEPYRFLVMADFPVNVSDTAAKRLASILSSGARCGVYTLIVRDTRTKVPAGVDIDDMRRHSTTLLPKRAESTSETEQTLEARPAEAGDRFVWAEPDVETCPLTIDEPPDDAFITTVLKKVGEESIEASRVEVPFEVVAPRNGQMWSLRTDDELRVPLGRAGATKLQNLTLGRGTAQHVLIAGKTGSGKSTLLHALITNLSLWYGPDQVEMYLVDFKKGVEFKTYATHRVPHIRAVAIESDREFGVSVLQRVDQEMQRRGERFRQLGVQSLAAFRKAAPGEPMPRTLLIIDEFQEFFTEDDKIAQDAALLLDRLVRQGRAFGIHVLLGSQTLGGAYSLARSTIGQMAVRIALQCSEADSYLILSEDNAAARLLSRPGEAIYNDSNGTVEGNSPFQIVWLPDRERERWLGRVQEEVSKDGLGKVPPPIVFEGHIPADIRNNHHLEALLTGDITEPPGHARAWLGEAIAIKDPTSAVFRRQAASNLIIVGQQEEPALAIMAAGLVSLAAFNPNARFIILDGSPPETNHSEHLQRLADALPHDVTLGRVREAGTIVSELAEEVDRRQSSEDSPGPPIYLAVYGIQRFRDLRQEEDFGFSMDEDKPPSPGKRFGEVLREGPPLGIHSILWADTVGTINRTFDRQGMSHFDQRVLFQMSAGDSTLVIDSPAAGKLGFHRALFASEEEAILEKFRPYALPDRDWLDEAGARLRNRIDASRL